jgi:hypothetical protein
MPFAGLTVTTLLNELLLYKLVTCEVKTKCHCIYENLAECFEEPQREVAKKVLFKPDLMIHGHNPST